MPARAQRQAETVQPRAVIFFVREPEPVQPIPNGRDRHLQPVLVAQCLRHSLLRQIALFLQLLANPRLIRANLAPARIALPLRRKRTGLALEAHHVVDELNRNPEMRRMSGSLILPKTGN